ncbi:MAG: acyltransferase [Eubacterium sp.]|nr:acyltransferase [Eubacterium sp.]
MADYILLLIPAAIVTILVFGAGVKKKGEFSEKAWSLGQAKAIQAFAALMIILHHLVQTISSYGAVNKGPVTVWNSFGILFTSIFFFFSGFGLYKRYKAEENYLDSFLKRRFLKILIPFLFTNVIYLCTVSGGKISGVWQGITAIFGIPLLNVNAWYVIVLLLLYLAFYVCFRFIRSERAAMLCLTGFTILVIIGSLMLGHDSRAVNRRWFMGEWWYNTMFLFIVGMVVARNETRIRALMEKRYAILLPLSVILFGGWSALTLFVGDHFGYYSEWPGHPGYFEKLITLLTQIILCILFLSILLVVNLKVEFHNRILRFLGGISYEIYLIHEVFREVLPGGPGGTLPDFPYLVLVYMLSIAAAWLLAFADRCITGQSRKRSEH